MERSDCLCTRYLIFAILPFVVTGCNEKILPPDDKELLMAVVWGETNSTITDPELYTCVFEPSGDYYTTYKGYETARYSWRLISDKTLMVDQSEVEITILTPTILEYRAGASFLGIPYKVTYHLQALKETVAETLGFSDLKMVSARLHGIIRFCTASDVSFEYGLTQYYGQSSGLTGFPGPVHQHTSKEVTGLTPGTKYHYRLKVANEEGTYYGTDHTFTTYDDQTVTDADNNEYFTVRIGSQTWMAENLRTTKYNDGTAIPGIADSEAWNKLITPAFCWSDNDSLSFSKSGAIYNWHAVSGGKLCPAGWHVPSASEWSGLFGYMTGRENELITTDYEFYNDFLWDRQINQSGFSADMARLRDAEGYFGVNGYSHFWTGSEMNSDEARFVMLYYGYTGLNQLSKKSGLQVRCLKDQ